MTDADLPCNNEPTMLGIIRGAAFRDGSRYDPVKSEDHEIVAAARDAAAVLCALHKIGVASADRDIAKHICQNEMDVRALLQFAFRKIAEDEAVLVPR